MTQMLHVYLLQCINIERRREYWSKIEKKKMSRIFNMNLWVDRYRQLLGIKNPLGGQLQ